MKRRAAQEPPRPISFRQDEAFGTTGLLDVAVIFLHAAAMGYLIGTDEAGYGPNLGPLVISATVWRVPDVRIDLYEALADVVSAEPHRRDHSDPRMVIADSKKVYSPGNGLSGLESPLFAVSDDFRRHRRWRNLWQSIATESWDHARELPWYREFDCDLPIDGSHDEINGQSQSFQRALAQIGISLVKIRSVAIFPNQFNQLIDAMGSKGAVLSNATLDLVSNLVGELDEDEIYVVCDKHGGRNSYAPFLQPRFEDRLVRVFVESRAESRYQVGSTDRPITFCFRTNGESFLPSALASMASKYLRELAMKAFNQFWQNQQPSVRPTAGYPNDAKRFRTDIADAKKKLNIRDDLMWRQR